MKTTPKKTTYLFVTLQIYKNNFKNKNKNTKILKYL